MGFYEVNWTGSELGLAAGFCERGNEISDSMIARGLFYYEFLKDCLDEAIYTFYLHYIIHCTVLNLFRKFQCSRNWEYYYNL
jgi:hypothetical protein